jgi:hypothetical protein
MSSSSMKAGMMEDDGRVCGRKRGMQMATNKVGGHHTTDP